MVLGQGDSLGLHSPEEAGGGSRAFGAPWELDAWRRSWSQGSLTPQLWRDAVTTYSYGPEQEGV